MRSILEMVTITGADDSIDPEELFSMSVDYPFVEFGILLSAGQIGTRRFPSQEWLKKLTLHARDADIALSGHICGRWVRQIYMGSWPAELDMFAATFSRWQLNTHGQRTQCELGAMATILEERSGMAEQVIFQYDNVNVLPLEAAINGKFNVAALFDLSHGAGVLPTDWPDPIRSIPCGYAGGLAPDNVDAQLRLIEPKIPEGGKIWIDVETRIRSHDDQVFDIALVRDFLDAAKPWIAE